MNTPINKMLPARLHVKLARASSLSLVLRRGPTMHTASILWDRADDTFTLGQWLKGRIFAHECDVSPDGKHMIYRARGQHSYKSWIAVSCMPYLKALDFFDDADYYQALFLSNDTYWLATSIHKPKYKNSHLNITSCTAFGADNRYSEIIALRDGWNSIHNESAGYNKLIAFEKQIHPHWKLLKKVGVPIPKNKSPEYTPHQLLHIPTNTIYDKSDWEWADWDNTQQRLVCAEHGKLLSAQLSDNGIKNIHVLHDFNNMQFEEITAPY
jgi:hypothetical protein